MKPQQFCGNITESIVPVTFYAYMAARSVKENQSQTSKSNQKPEGSSFGMKIVTIRHSAHFENDSILCVPPPCLQAAVIRSAAACRAPRRSCSLRDGAWWETPRGTPAATRATRTWRMVMTALLSLDQHYLKDHWELAQLRPSLCLAVTPSPPFFFSPSFPGSHLRSHHLLNFCILTIRPSHNSGPASAPPSATPL